jgi:cell volume regulation protein A
MASIFAGLISSRVGAPLLLVFLGLGMLVGEDGPGGLPFSDYNAAYLIANVTLAIILFDGGLRTEFAAVRVSWGPAAVLATVGVAITAAITGLVASLVLGGGLLGGLLVGAIVGSTDAAAVFLLLHQRGLELRRRLSATLEVESGANDPMAIFLTVTIVELIGAGAAESSWLVLELFLKQMTIGAAAGLAGGWALAWVVNRVELESGLYPVFAVAAALLVFGATDTAGGSGFLAVYIAGIVAGNQRMRASQLIRRFNDGIAWLSQIVMFLMLGLLVTPSSLPQQMTAGVIVALVLMFVARPIAVALCLAPFRFPRQEQAFVAWVGLRGAVPLFLAIIPIVSGTPNAMAYFNVAFIIVIASLVLQGWTIPWIARRLGVDVPPGPAGAGRIEFDFMREFDRDLVGYRIAAASPAAHRGFADLPLPKRVRTVAVVREGVLTDRNALDRLRTGDYVLMMAPPEQTARLDRLFTPPAAGGRQPSSLGDFAFPAATTMGALAEMYGLTLSREDGDEPVGRFLRRRLGHEAAVGDRLRVGVVDLVVREIEKGEIASVGVDLEPADVSLVPRRLIRLWRAVRPVLGPVLRRRRTPPPEPPAPDAETFDEAEDKVVELRRAGEP